MKLNKIYFTSEIETKYAEQAEQLFFFNKNQKRYYNKIESICEKYGTPRLDKSGFHLRFILGDSDMFQTTYAIDQDKNGISILGMLIYFRPKKELIEVVHIAVVEECSESGAFGKEMIVVRLIERLRRDAKSLKGVKKIKLPYNGVMLDISNKILNSEE